MVAEVPGKGSSARHKANVPTVAVARGATIWLTTLNLMMQVLVNRGPLFPAGLLDGINVDIPLLSHHEDDVMDVPDFFFEPHSVRSLLWFVRMELFISLNKNLANHLDNLATFFSKFGESFDFWLCHNSLTVARSLRPS